ncbi:MAG: hypothetical protein NVS2B16_00330 [Chloroflexota bacterium]
MSRKFALAVTAIAIGCVFLLIAVRHHASVSLEEAEREATVACAQAATAWTRHESRTWITVTARVVRLLPETYGRYEHQRFVVHCTSGRSILVTNDVSIGTRAPIAAGATVTVHGEYIWNRQGGLVHFTHHSDSGGPGGWILYRHKLYAWISLRTKTWTTGWPVV